MGRLSTFAKNRILFLRFQRSFRIKQIALSLQQEDNIKVSRKSISTFLKKYIETKSINDKPRSGRNKKLTPEEINLIGEITRLNRDITAPKIKEYLNLNVSTYTILRASKLFEWNKLNPNSNEAKKAAALKRQLNGEVKQRKTVSSRKTKSSLSVENQEETSLLNHEINISDENIVKLNSSFESGEDKELDFNPNLDLLPEYEIINTKNVSSSAMVFATKILYKIFHLNELLGHNVSGKTFNKYIKGKKALDQKRIYYIKWLVEKYFDSNNKVELWKSCRTAINKSIRNNEIKVNGMNLKENKSSINDSTNASNEPRSYNIVDLSSNIINESICASVTNSLNTSPNTMCNVQQTNGGLINLEPNMSIFQMSNDLPNLDLVLNKPMNSSAYKSPNMTSVVTLTDPSDLVGQFIQEEGKTYMDLKSCFKKDYEDTHLGDLETSKNMNILSEDQIMELKNMYCSPMVFSTKVLIKIFTKSELLGHNVASIGKNASKALRNKEPLDEERINYINWLVNTYFDYNDAEKQDLIWKSCRKAINRVIRNIEIKESKLIKSCVEKDENFEDLNQIIGFN